jgi:hypothetical protein
MRLYDVSASTPPFVITLKSNPRPLEKWVQTFRLVLSRRDMATQRHSRLGCSCIAWQAWHWHYLLRFSRLPWLRSVVKKVLCAWCIIYARVHLSERISIIAGLFGRSSILLPERSIILFENCGGHLERQVKIQYLFHVIRRVFVYM